MKKEILVGILLIFCTFTIYACNSNNEFVLSENVTVCLGQGIYENATGYVDFNGSENCRIFAYYPNDSKFIDNQAMSFASNQYQYNLGYLPTYGQYSAFSYCYKNKGWWQDWWTFDVFQFNCSSDQIRAINGTCLDTNQTAYPSLSTAIATGTTYQKGEKIKTLTSCLDSNNQPINANATVTIYYPNNTLWINNESMSVIETGIFNYSNYAPSTKGIYLLKSVCFSGGKTATSISEIQVPEWISGTSDYLVPNITLVTPTNGSTQISSSLVVFNVTTSENATCTMDLESVSYPLTSSGGQSHSIQLSLSNANYNYNFTCSDASDNINTTENYLLTINYQTSGGGGGLINLDKINLTADDWLIKKNNLLVLETFDSGNQRVDVTDYNFKIEENISYEIISIERIEPGLYYLYFYINDTSLKQINVDAQVNDRGHVITDSIAINLKKESILNKLVNTSKNLMEDFGVWINENPELFWIILIMIFIGLIIISYLIYYLSTK